MRLSQILIYRKRFGRTQRSKAIIRFIDTSRLDAYEGVFPNPAGAYRRYSFHWAKADQTLIIRWDNAPHYPDLENAPHHKHFEQSVEPSPAMTLEMVLTEIQTAIL